MSPHRGRTLVEKTPINALRIGFLDAIAPGSRFVHIVRDGIHVSRSIEQIAAVSRGVAFRPSLNNWWGVGNVKWTALDLILPEQMCIDFNEWQEHYRFAGGASALEDSAVPGSGALLDGRGV